MKKHDIDYSVKPNSALTAAPRFYIHTCHNKGRGHTCTHATIRGRGHTYTHATIRGRVKY